MTAKFHQAFAASSVKFLLPQKPDGVTMQRVTASQASFSIVIGEPGHTKPRAAKAGLGTGYDGLFVRFSVH